MWKVIDCFVGSECWCGIVVSPDGEECNNYGEVSREDCQYIVDALNKTPGAESNVNERHPTPWHVQTFKQHSKVCIVTTKGLANDLVEDSIGFVYNEHAAPFVEAVNGFYVK